MLRHLRPACFHVNQIVVLEEEYSDHDAQRLLLAVDLPGLCYQENEER
jgi:hypothetical protein